MFYSLCLRITGTSHLFSSPMTYAAAIPMYFSSHSKHHPMDEEEKEEVEEKKEEEEEEKVEEEEEEEEEKEERMVEVRGDMTVELEVIKSCK
ncbi:hypothetical protein M8J77_012363 [Diaphorina citri]|nr:hypothetical protein M8J77_012363 [Diaphorina citri]